MTLLRPMTRRPARRAGVAPILLLALALAGCLFESTPPAPTPVPPTPTPVPPPTPTVQQRVAFPTAAPTARASPTPAPLPSPTPVAELRGAGQLLYIGSLEGKSGVIAVNADGSDRRLLAEGIYDAVLWSPDGERFVAAGARGNGPSQVDLYTASGRLLRNTTFAGQTVGFAWAPDSRRLALATHDPPGPGSGSGPGQLLVITTWLLDEGGATEIPLGRQTYPASWSARGRLALSVYDDSDGDGKPSEGDRRGIWTVDATGGEARPLTVDTSYPLGWSADGATLYALGDLQPVDTSSGRSSAAPTSLLAIDADSGARRTVATVADLSAQAAPDGQPAPRRWVVWGLAAPSGERIALWLTDVSVFSSGSQGRGDSSLMVVVDGNGRVIWQDRAQPYPGGVAWSPDGTRFVYPFSGPGGGAGRATSGLRLFDVETGEASLLAESFAIGEVELRWSPDGRWLALAWSNKLEIVSGAAPASAWTLATGGRSPSWRPAR